MKPAHVVMVMILLLSPAPVCPQLVRDLDLKKLFPNGGMAFPADNATQMPASSALEHINNRTDVLGDYRLVMDASDTQGSSSGVHERVKVHASAPAPADVTLDDTKLPPDTKCQTFWFPEEPLGSPGLGPTGTGRPKESI